jgi:hypothetical protein
VVFGAKHRRGAADYFEPVFREAKRFLAEALTALV